MFAVKNFKLRKTLNILALGAESIMGATEFMARWFPNGARIFLVDRKRYGKIYENNITRNRDTIEKFVYGCYNTSK